MKKISIIAIVLAAVFAFPAFTHAASISIEVIEEVSIAPEKKIVTSGDMNRIVYKGSAIKKWKASFKCPKGVSVFLDDEDLCKVTKNFGKSKNSGFALPLRFVNANSSSKQVKLTLKAYDEKGKYDSARANVTVRGK